MKPAIDNILFDEESFELRVGCVKREIIQRSAAGLDGQLCIDLGIRSRTLTAKGELRARSRNELNKKIEQINMLIDGQLHTLRCSDGSLFCNLLVQEFESDSIVNSGADVSCMFKMTFLQQSPG